MKRSKLFLVIGITFMVLSVSMVLYPTISNAINSFYSISTIKDYTKYSDTISATDRLSLLSVAEKYNKTLRDTVSTFSYSTDSLVDSYDDALNFEDGLIGYIEIKKINVKLPIYHGSDPDVLKKGVAHIPNSALPTGGIGNNTVLSAHTGYPTQVFFDNLTELTVGDTINIYVLDNTLTYKITAKNIVEPDDTSLLNADDTKDLLSLITCYPYGVNSHRLIVTAERVIVSSTHDEAIESTKSESKNSFEIIISAIIAFSTVAIIVTIARKRRKKYIR